MALFRSTISTYSRRTVRRLDTSTFALVTQSMFEFVQDTSDSRLRSRSEATAMHFSHVAPLRLSSGRSMTLSR